MAKTIAPKPVVDHDDPFSDTRMSIGDHIEELRAHLFRAIYALLIGVALGLWPVGWYAFEFITRPVELELQEYFKRQDKREEDDFVAKNPELKPMRLDLRVDRRALAALMKGDAEPKAPEPKIAEEDEAQADWVALPAQINDPKQLVPLVGKLHRDIHPRRLSALSPQEVFLVYMQVALLVGVVLASPWIFYEIWSFIAAGLYPTEKRLVNVYMPFSIGLFLLGFIVCEWFALPNAIRGLLWFNEWLGINPEIRLSEWLGFALILPLVFGISFQTPLVMLFLFKIGLFDVASYVAFRRYAWFGMAAVVVVFAPVGDLQSLALLWGPMCLLYEIGIIICRMQPPRPVDEFDDSELDGMIGV
jgi:sec-independent protein translocase protein TatC